MTAALDDYVDLLWRGERRDAVRLVLDLHAGGMPVDGIVLDVLAPAMDRVGRSWARGLCTAAEEHRATSICQGALAALPPARPADAASVVLACPDGEWHSLPAELFGRLLEQRGIAVTYLGPSVPARDLEGLLRQEQPTALALSCSMHRLLLSAAAAIQGASRAGVPAIVGGAAFDPTSARRVGAAAGPTDGDHAATLLRRWHDGIVPRTHPDVDDRAYRLQGSQPDLVLAAMVALSATHERAVDDLRVRTSLNVGLTAVVAALASAVAVGDPSRLAGHLRATRPRWVVDGVPVALQLAAIRALGRAVEQEHPDIDLTWLSDVLAGTDAG